MPTADRQKATVRVRIAFDQLDPRILPDMGIKVSFLEPEDSAAQAKQGPKIPDNALVKDGSATYVWLVRDSRVEKRPVKAGASEGGQVAVTEGLQGGEVVVIDPAGPLARRRSRGVAGRSQMTEPGEPIVRIRNLVKEYRRGAEVVRVLDGLSLDIAAGDYVALMGPSGSGQVDAVEPHRRPRPSDVG